MKPLAVALVAAVALCGAAADGAAQTSRFKGWAPSPRSCRPASRPKGESLDLDRFLPAADMEDLLGSWSTFGSEHAFQNGLPNSSALPSGMPPCRTSPRASARPAASRSSSSIAQFAETLQTLCTWPAAGARATRC